MLRLCFGFFLVFLRHFFFKEAKQCKTSQLLFLSWRRPTTRRSTGTGWEPSQRGGARRSSQSRATGGGVRGEESRRSSEPSEINFNFPSFSTQPFLEKIAMHFCRTFPASELSLSPLAVRSPAAQEGRRQASDDVEEPEQRQFLRGRDCAEESCPVLGPRYL